MPTFTGETFLHQNEAETFQECTVARRQMVFFELCPSEDWSRDAFNEMSKTLGWIGNLFSTLTKLTQQQDEIKQPQTELSNRINTIGSQNTCNQIYNEDKIQNINSKYRITADTKFREDIRAEETFIEETKGEEVGITITEEITQTTIEGTTKHQQPTTTTVI